MTLEDILNFHNLCILNTRDEQIAHEHAKMGVTLTNLCNGVVTWDGAAERHVMTYHKNRSELYSRAGKLGEAVLSYQRYVTIKTAYKEARHDD